MDAVMATGIGVPTVGTSPATTTRLLLRADVPTPVAATTSVGPVDRAG